MSKPRKPLVCEYCPTRGMGTHPPRATHVVKGTLIGHYQWRACAWCASVAHRGGPHNRVYRFRKLT